MTHDYAPGRQNPRIPRQLFRRNPLPFAQFTILFDSTASWHQTLTLPATYAATVIATENHGNPVPEANINSTSTPEPNEASLAPGVTASFTDKPEFSPTNTSGQSTAYLFPGKLTISANKYLNNIFYFATAENIPITQNTTIPIKFNYSLVQLSGVLRNAEGTPLSGIELGWYGSGSKADTTTDESGAFSLEVPAEESGELIFSIEHPAPSLHLPFAQFTILFDSTASWHQTLTLPATYAATVIATENHGNPVPEANINSTSTPEPNEASLAPGVTASFTDKPEFSPTNTSGQSTAYLFPGKLTISANKYLNNIFYFATAENIPITQNTTIPIKFNYSASPISQSIAFESTPPPGPNRGSVYLVAASATSGLPVSFSVDPHSSKKACSINGSVVLFVTVGSCVIDANQGGDNTYAPAPQLQEAITVTEGPASTVTDLSLAHPTLTYGHEEEETFTATVVANGGGVVPTGRVVVKAGTKTLCSIKVIDGRGSCSPKATVLKKGTYLAIATFAESGRFLGSSSPGSALEIA